MKTQLNANLLCATHTPPSIYKNNIIALSWRDFSKALFYLLVPRITKGNNFKTGVTLYKMYGVIPVSSFFQKHFFYLLFPRITNGMNFKIGITS